MSKIRSEIDQCLRRAIGLAGVVGRGQLSFLDERVAARRANFEFYREALGGLPGISFMPEPEGFFSTRWLTCITIDPGEFGATRVDIEEALEAENIEARPLSKPMHMQPVFKDCRMVGGEVCERLFELGLCLPSGSNLREADRERIAGVVKSVFR